jgi:hypothetical protein
VKILTRLLLVLFFATALLLTFLAAPWLDNLARRVHRKLGYPAKNFGIELPPRPTPRALPTPTPTPTPKPTPPPQDPTPEPTPTEPTLIRIPRQELNTAQLWSGITANRTLLIPEGASASAERNNPAAYLLEMTFTATLPRAATSLEDFQHACPRLAETINDLPLMLQNARVSRFFEALYEEKIKINRQNLGILSALVSRHNFYDCDTILEITHPRTRRKIFLIQADMDVVTDGTDPERTLEYDTTSPSFQPITNYGWPRRSRTPENPTIPRYRELLKQRRDELNSPNTTPERKTALRNSIAYLQRLIADLQARSFLVAHGDPFIVIPLSMRGAGAPEIGDYAVVLHGGRAFPAIVGEYGPREKIGEASTRIAREIIPNITGLQRPVSNLSVTYIIFPGTAEKPFRRPDLKHWHNRVQKLLEDIGGLSVPLHEFEDIFATPGPSPSPTPTPPAQQTSATPETSPMPTASPQQSPLPSPTSDASPEPPGDEDGAAQEPVSEDAPAAQAQISEDNSPSDAPPPTPESQEAAQEIPAQIPPDTPQL